MPRTSPRHRNDTHRGSAAETAESPRIASRSHAAPRGARRAPAALALSVLAVTGVVGTHTLSGSDQSQQAAVLPVSSDIDSDAASRSSSALPLDDSLSEAATTVADITSELTAQQKAAEEKARKKAEAEKKEAAAKKRIDDAIADPRGTAEAMLAEYGWSGQFGCLDSLWVGESNWDHTATNPSSGAYGIPQSLPATKMASAGSDWKTNPITQIRWGLDYIKDVYGSPCSADSFKQGNGWY